MVMKTSVRRLLQYRWPQKCLPIDTVLMMRGRGTQSLGQLHRLA